MSGDNEGKIIKEEMIEKLVSNLPALRAKLEITQTDLADSIGIGRQTLLAIENKRGRMRWDTFLAAIIVFSKNDATSDYMKFLGLHLETVEKMIQNEILDKRGCTQMNSFMKGFTIMKLVLIRHGESEWNKENRFTGWTDVDLSDTGRREAAEAGQVLKDNGYDFDICYTSYLKRAIHTLNSVLESLDREWLPVIKTWKLNERHYGALQGLNKSETAAKYGDEQVKIWRRSFDIQPPALTEDDERNPAHSVQYRADKDVILPLTESLKDTIARTVPYFEEVIKPEIQDGKKVLIAAHGNSLRALVKYFEDLSEDEILEVNIPTGIPLVYEFDDNFTFVKKYYLGDESAIAEKMNKVANQGKSK